MLNEKVEIGSYRFPGFYESVFCNSDEFIYEELDWRDAINKVHCEEVTVEIEYVDFNQYKLDVCRVFMEYYVDAVKDVLPAKIIDEDYFVFDFVDDGYSVSSPKYYNYGTDNAYGFVETNKESLLAIKDYTLGLDGAEKYILNNYTSHDGFISFISNDIRHWRESDIDYYCYEQNILIALLDMLLVLSGRFDEVVDNTREDSYDYKEVIEFVYENGESFTLMEFLDNYGYDFDDVYPY